MAIPRHLKAETLALIEIIQNKIVNAFLLYFFFPFDFIFSVIVKSILIINLLLSQIFLIYIHNSLEIMIKLALITLLLVVFT